MIGEYQQRCAARVDALLAELFEAPRDELARLYQAMRYSVVNGGKRVRPLLVYAACEALDGDLDRADGAACAVELIHAYSLVHDDLPAMDDDDLRRGQPTTHIAYDEACAILAGDGLQSLAFEALADARRNPADAHLRLSMVMGLARAAGPAGMVGGQAIDLESVGRQLDQQALETMHRHKTGALIEASVQLGALAQLAPDTPHALVREGGYMCTNAACAQPLGLASLVVQLETAIRAYIARYYHGYTVCTEPTCGVRTNQAGVYSGRCLAANCRGTTKREYSDKQLYTQLCYLDYLFDADRALAEVGDAPHRAYVHDTIRAHRAAIDALRAAVQEEEARRQAAADEAAEGEDGARASREGVVTLRQRVWPLIEMIERSQQAATDVVWGV